MDPKRTSKILRVRKVAKLLDSQFKGPFGTRFGLDGIIGLVPGIGDLVTNLISGLILYESYLLGAPSAVIARMGWNLILENLVDTIPFVGNLFDFYWKANLKNVKLLEEHIARPIRTNANSKLLMVGIFVFILALISFSVYISYLFITLILEAFNLFTS